MRHRSNAARFLIFLVLPVSGLGHARPSSQDAGAKPQEEPAWTLKQAWHDQSNLSQIGQVISPAGKSVSVDGRVTGLAFARRGKFLVVKSSSRVSVVDAESFAVLKQVPYPEEAGSMYGLAVAPDDATIYFTGNGKNLFSAAVDENGGLSKPVPHSLAVKVEALNPLGVALPADGKTALVALSLVDQVAVVDLPGGRVRARIAVGVCPYGVVVSPDGKTALVGNFGGPHPKKGDKTEKSGGADMAVDERSVLLRGSVSVIDLRQEKVVGEIATRIHPEAMCLSPDGKSAFVVDAGGDGVSVIDLATHRVTRTLGTKPQADLPYGSLTTGLCFSADGATLFTANAGNNAVALLNPARPGDPPIALIPAGGFPGAVCARGGDLFIGNVYGYHGNLQKVTLPTSAEEREKMTSVAREGFHLSEILRATARTKSSANPLPVPTQLGGPSSIKHVVYVIKENKKYDQMLGDIGRGNSEPKFCEFPRETTPNTHALADQFVLLDNYYCNGVLSCDGHQWATQGETSPMREKDWDGAIIPYDFGTSPLSYAGCGFIWDHVIHQGLSFRNFGEFDVSQTHDLKWHDFYDAWKNKTGKVKFECVYKLDALRRYSDMRYPGWAMNIPDQWRADVFLQALKEFDSAGKMPDFVIIYLPNDHTAKDGPTPRAFVADNDLALGRIVEGLSKSRFWKDMVVFVNEDDPQTGTDHVDGHRSLCLVAGPYVKRGGVVISRFYNQSSVLHTICRIFGLPPLNQIVAASPLMTDCFQEKPDLTPYKCVPAKVPLDEGVSSKVVSGKNERLLASSLRDLDFSRPDQIDKSAELYSRWVWATVRGDEPFPAEYFGAHGKGLEKLGLRLEPRVREGEDDDDDD